MAESVIRLSRPEDLDRIMEITDQAKAQMKRMGLDQWQKGYPARYDWEADIVAGRGYVVCRDEKIVGAFAYLADEEESYREIDGAWLIGGYEGGKTYQDAIKEDVLPVTYASIHRTCVADEAKGTGVAGDMFRWSIEKAKEDGMKSVRIDTHPENEPMKRAVTKDNFIECGTIILTSGLEKDGIRVAYEILI